MTKLKIVPHTLKKEFKRERCGCNHSPPDDFFKSQWQGRTKSTAYLIYRWIIALLFTAIVIDSMIDPNDPTSFWLYFIYLTNWGILMCMITSWFGAVLVSVWHFHPELSNKLINMTSITCPFRIYWILHSVSLVASIVITIIYWSVLYNGSQEELTASNILTHAFNSIIMFIDFLIVAHPLRLLHVFFPLCIGAFYSAFSAIYPLCGGKNKTGDPFIYYVLDWNQPAKATLTAIGVLFLSFFVYMVLFLIYKLRILVYRRFNDNFVLPTTVSKSGNDMGNADKSGKQGTVESGIQHSPSGISMVLGSSSGHQNQAFQASKENVSA